MTDQEQIKALAELDGWTTYSPGDFDPTPRWEHKLIAGKVVQTSNLPPYLTSRDAIIPVIEKQPNDVLYRCVKFFVVADHDMSNIIALLLAPPSLIAEALLRSNGKWKD